MISAWEIRREMRYEFLAKHAIEALPAKRDDDARPKLLWAKRAATRAYDSGDNADRQRMRDLFDIRSPVGAKAADVRVRTINAATNFILNEGTRFYDWLFDERSVRIGWTDLDGRSRGLRQVRTKEIAERQARATERWRDGSHQAADKMLADLSQRTGIEVNRTRQIEQKAIEHKPTNGEAKTTPPVNKMLNLFASLSGRSK